MVRLADRIVYTMSTQTIKAHGATRVVGIYVRISDDQAGDAAGVARQKRDAAKLCERNGWAFKVYEDNDFSAFKRKVTRPAFEAMLADLKAGVITGVVAYDLDRLWRQPIDLERAIEIYETHRDYAFATLAQSIDLSTPDGQMLARVMVAAANKASADTARRVTRKHQEIQESGKPGGGPRPFGFAMDRITRDPVEAAAVVEIVDRLLTGATVADQVKWLKAKGIKTSKGNDFTPASLRATLRNPRLIGMRAKWTGNGWEPVMADGQPVKAVWEPIVDPALWDDLQARFASRANPIAGMPREAARRYLLSGIARCGACGSPMMGRSSGNGRGSTSYACPTVAQGGCGSVARVCKRVDGIVTTAVLTALSADLADAHAAPGEWEGQGEFDRLTALKDSMWEAFKAGHITDSASYFRERAEVDGMLKALTNERKAHTRTVAAHAEAVDVAKQWKTATLTEKRAAVRSVFSAVIVEPLPVVDGRKVKAWNPELVRCVPA